MNADATAYIRITDDDYELIEIEDQKALFTNEKLYTSTIPKGMHCYHLRHDDVGGINFVALVAHIYQIWYLLRAKILRLLMCYRLENIECNIVNYLQEINKLESDKLNILRSYIL